MAAFLKRGFNLPSTNTDFFVDDEASIFEGDINRLAASGITLGCNPPSEHELLPESDRKARPDGFVPGESAPAGHSATDDYATDDGTD